MKKVLIILMCLTLIIIIYKFTYNDKIDYLAIGDGLAQGKTHYGTVGYGYTDYIKDYLKLEKKLKTFNKTFAEDEMTAKELINNIKTNKSEVINGRRVHINNAIANAEIITISIGNHEISELNKYIKNEEEALKIVKNLINDIKTIINLTKKYNQNSNIYLIGFYSYQKENNKITNYTNQELKKLSKKYSFNFVKISDIFDNNIKYLPNTLENYPSNLGYKEIAKRVSNKIVF